MRDPEPLRHPGEGTREKQPSPALTGHGGPDSLTLAFSEVGGELATVVLQPTANRGSRAHYVDTIESPVRFADHADVIPGGILEHLDRIFPGGVAPMWGVTPAADGSNIARYERASLGGVVLFAANRRIFSAGTIAVKFRNARLARKLWGEDQNGMTWEYMYVLDEMRALEIPYEEFNPVAGYKVNNIIQGFTVLKEDAADRVLAHFDLWSERHESTDGGWDEALAGLDGELDREVRSWVRREQQRAKNLLLGNADSGECRLCGRRFGRSLLIAAHKKRRALCTDAERRDIRNNMMLCCVFGCDALFERGFITVSQDGRIHRSESLAAEPAAAAYAESEILASIALDDGEIEYFEWHHAWHRQARRPIV